MTHSRALRGPIVVGLMQGYFGNINKLTEVVIGHFPHQHATMGGVESVVSEPERFGVRDTACSTISLGSPENLISSSTPIVAPVLPGHAALEAIDAQGILIALPHLNRGMIDPPRVFLGRLESPQDL